MADAPTLVQVYLVDHCLETGLIVPVMAEIAGDTAIVHAFGARLLCGDEGRRWHRTRWAAENYACQIQAERLAWHREEIARLERYRFGRVGR